MPQYHSLFLSVGPGIAPTTCPAALEARRALVRLTEIVLARKK